MWDGSWFADFLCDAVTGHIESNDIANLKMTQHEFRQPSVCASVRRERSNLASANHRKLY